MGSPDPSIFHREACQCQCLVDAGPSIWRGIPMDSPLCGSVFLVGKHVKGSLGVGGIDTNASEFGVSGKASCPAPGGLSVFGIV